MHQHDVRTRLGEAACAPAAWAASGAEALALETHASEGCSICARALVNTRDLAVSLALSGAPASPAPRSRDRLLSRAQGVLAARKHAGPGAPDEADHRPRRVLDPSAAVAHVHLAHPSEPERVREIDALRATELRPGEGSERLLAQLARFVDFSILFVSIVRGERAIYRAQHGLARSQVAFRELRREMSYCTHTVSSGAPLVVENARVEPFFRGNKAVTRFGIVAYAGVPLRTAAGIVVGTLCALHGEPRTITPATVALLEVFARRAVAEIERERTPALLAALLPASSERGDVHAQALFHDLVAAEHARESEQPRAGRSALLAFRAGSAEEALARVEPHEAAGELSPGVFGLLLPGVGAEAAAERLARLRGASGSSAAGLSLSNDAGAPSDWVARSAQQLAPGVQ